MTRLLIAALAILLVARVEAQIQVELKFPRVQYIAYEPVVGTVEITNLAGRDVDLDDANGERWFGFEITTNDGRYLERLTSEPEAPLHIESGKTVTRKVNLTPLFPIHDLGPYHARAHVYFADLKKFFYSQGKVFNVVDVHPFWQRTVGVPEGERGAGEMRTYSLLSSRFADHTSIYVRVEDKETGVVYNTFSLGRSIAFDEPQAELDPRNRLHVLHCAAPRTWAYNEIGPNGQVIAHSTILETKSRPRMYRGADGTVRVRGGMLEAPAQTKQNAKLSDRPPQDD
ncbi:MAG TPA: hypothetical protein VGC85_07235 [Chthoniobacterales bacterium]